MRLTQRKRRRVDTNFDRAFDVNLSLCEYLQQPLSAEDPDSTPAAADDSLWYRPSRRTQQQLMRQ